MLEGEPKKKISRGRLVKLSSAFILSYLLLNSPRRPQRVVRDTDMVSEIDIVRNNHRTERSSQLGITFSTLQCRYLGMNEEQTKETLAILCSMGFDTIRICTYWNRVDQGGRLDFKEIDWQIKMADQYYAKVILTIGKKAPRWPEFHFPRYILEDYPKAKETPQPDTIKEIADRSRDVDAKVVEHTRDHPALAEYQVENEPLNPVLVTSLRSLSYPYIQEKVDLIRSLIRPHQRFSLTCSVGIPPADQKFNDLLTLNPDVVGLNVYNKTPLPLGTYFNIASTFWESQIVKWRQELVRRKIKPAVYEAQAEPWEWNKLVNMDQREYHSANPHESIELVDRLISVGYDPVLFWGAEYWVAHHWKFGGGDWLNPMREYLNNEYPLKSSPI